MNPDRLKKIEDLYHATIDKPPHMRSAWLADACKGDANLRSQVESLLKAGGNGDGFLHHPALKNAAAMMSKDTPAISSGGAAEPLFLHLSGSGTDDIYVRPFPAGGGVWQISTGHGTRPTWSADGKELFYLNAGAIMAVDIGLQLQCWNPVSHIPCFECPLKAAERIIAPTPSLQMDNTF